MLAGNFPGWDFIFLAIRNHSRYLTALYIPCELRGIHCSVTPETMALPCCERGHLNPVLAPAPRSPRDEHGGINEQLWLTRLSQVPSGLRADWVPKSDASEARSPTGSGDSIENKAELKSFVDSTP